MRRRALIAGLLVWNARRALAAGPPGVRRPWIHLETRPCYGTCPVFALTVHPDGEVTYEGRRCVIRKGAARSRLSPGQLTELRNAIERSGFWTLPASCCDCRDVTDNPWTMIQIAPDQPDAPSKTIAHYHGCRSAPQAIALLGLDIVALAGATRWIGTFEQRSQRKWRRGC